MDSGRVPNDWKKANVTAILKKKDKSWSKPQGLAPWDKSSPCNYRPVSLTSHVRKVFYR